MLVFLLPGSFAYSCSFRLLRLNCKSQAGSLYWQQFEGPVQEASNQANNLFLQANMQIDGVQSYGRMIDLVLAWYEQQRSDN